MKRPRYNITNGKWFKGNVHIHSIVSDGGKSFSEIAELYASLGYDFLYRTDHWVASDVGTDTSHYPLLWLDGIEIHAKGQSNSIYHILCLGTLAGISNEMTIKTALEIARKQNALVILAHPYWSGNDFDDIFRYKFDGVEKYNHVTGWLNGKSDIYYLSLSMMLISQVKFPVITGGGFMLIANNCQEMRYSQQLNQVNFIHHAVRR